jgi:hypothetical protein
MSKSTGSRASGSRSTTVSKSTSPKQFGSGGGGINTKEHVRTPVRAGPPNTKVISPSAAANIGASKGDHVTEGGTVQRPSDPLVAGTRPQVASGNDVARNVGRGGPGAGRTVYRSGTQGVHGSVNPGLPPIPGTPAGGPGGMGFPSKGER